MLERASERLRRRVDDEGADNDDVSNENAAPSHSTRLRFWSLRQRHATMHSASVSSLARESTEL